MSVRKLLLGVAAGVVGLSAMWMARGKDGAGAGEGARSSWVRSARLAQKLDHPLGIAVDGDYVYVATGGFKNADNAILRVPAAGGAVEKLVKLEQIVSGELIVDGDYVYFTSQWGNLVLRVPKAGGMVTMIAEAPAPLCLASDATHIYFVTFSTDPDSGTLQRVAKAGGPPEVLLRGHPGMDQLVVDEQAVYFRSNLGLWKIGKSGGQAEQLLQNGEHKNLGRLVGDAAYLYFFYESKTQGRYEVARLPKAGGSPQVIGPIAVSTGRLALSDSHVYFFREASLTENLLVKVPKAGGPPETVDGTGYSTGHLSVSGGDVYFTDIAAVYRVPK